MLKEAITNPDLNTSESKNISVESALLRKITDSTNLTERQFVYNGLYSSIKNLIIPTKTRIWYNQSNIRVPTRIQSMEELLKETMNPIYKPLVKGKTIIEDELFKNMIDNVNHKILEKF